MSDKSILAIFKEIYSDRLIGIDSEYSGNVSKIEELPSDKEEMPTKLAETEDGSDHINVSEADPVNITYFEDGAIQSSEFIITLKQDNGATLNEVDFPVRLVQVATACCQRSGARIGIKKPVSKMYLIMHEALLGKKKVKDIKSKLNAVLENKNIKLDAIDSFNPERGESAIIKATELLRKQEAELIDGMARRSVNNENWMIVDGPLSIKEGKQNFDLDGYKYMVGVIKQFHDKYEKRPSAQTINTLPEGYRTKAYIPETKKDKGNVALWYLRLRRPDRPNDRSHIVACELLIPEGKEMKIETELINRVSKAILEEAYPLCYGADEKRWRTHLYPVFITEKTCKSLFYSKIMLDEILK